MADKAPPVPAPKQPVQRTNAPPVAAGGTNPALVAAQFGLRDDGAFVLPIGAGVRLGPELLGKAKVEIDRKHLPSLPGLRLDSVGFDPGSRSAMVAIKGKTAIPLTEERPFALNFGRDGKPSAFSIHTKATLDWIGRPDLRLSWAPDTGLAASVTVAASKFLPASLAKVATATGDVTLSLDQGKLSGDLDTVITIRDMLRAEIKGGFGPAGLAAKVALDSQSKWLGEVKGLGAINAAGVLSARIEKQATELPTPVRGLSFKGGMLSVALNPDRTISGGFTGLTLDYAGLATATASFMIEGGKYSGSAELDLTIPGFSAAKGKIAMKDGKLSGAFEIKKDAFPAGLPLGKGTIAGSVSETGALAFKGSVGITLGPAGTGQLEASYADESGFSIGAEVDLAIPGLQTAKFRIAYTGTDIAGAGELAIDPALLSGIEGRMKITYAAGLWAGETTLGYKADDGKLAGTITVRARQAEDKSIKISGDGEVTAKIAPRLEGKLQATILEEGGIDVSGSITVTDPIEMFPEKRFEKELINKSTNIPLWAILVAVLRFRAGVRAGIGPGVFRNITVTGSYSIGKEGGPSFAITGEMFIPAFVEGYVGFGAGLGLDVLLGSLTGGIEAMGTAGIYGAISVIPELEYKDGDYSISGVATMAAGARLKISLNAWAEIEALWITVWDNTWELASFTMPVGPDLGLSATMAYTFGKPEAPTLEFNTSDVDTDKLVSDAMPKDGPPSAGVRQETKNAAKWAGAQKAKGPAADAVPPELAQKEVPPVAAPPGKGKKSGKPPPGKPGEGKTLDPVTSAPLDPAKAAAQTKDAATPDPKAKGTVPDGQAASTKIPRHPAQVNLAMLTEPPVPMPRTKEQQEADVEAATQMVALVTGKVGDTDGVDDYFGQIKTRFGMSAIEYQVDPGPSVSVKVSANPVGFVKLNEVIKNLPTRKEDADAKNDIAFTMATRSYNLGKDSSGNDIKVTDSLGVKMVAKVLTPLHPQGTGPSDTALAPIFGYLETQGGTGVHGYIKGHLLNDNLGGPGAAENLYPISQKANIDHSNMIEKDAKALVNDQQIWVRYEVEIKNETVSEVPPAPGAKPNAPKIVSIDADLHASLAKLHTDEKNFTPVKSVVVKSRFNMTADQFKNAPAKSLSDKQVEDRDKAKEAFLNAPDINPAPGLAAEDNRSKVVTPPPPSVAGPATFKQTTADAPLVLLSKAHGKGSELRLDNVVGALAALARFTPTSAPFAGAATLTDRLGLAAYGAPDHAGVIGAANDAVKAHKAADATGNTDISASAALTAEQREVLGKITSTDSAKRIMDVLAQFAEEKKAGDRLAQKMGKDLTAADWNFLAARMATARPTDRITLAAILAKDYASRTAGREAMQAMGIWDSGDNFFISVKTKIEALKP